MPDPASIADTLAKVRELHKAEYDSVKNAAGKSALATKLAEQARAVSDDPTSQYVLLDEARRLALEAVQLAEAANWIDELSATFEVDPHRLKVEAAQRVHDLLVGPPPAPTVARVQMIDATLAATMLAVESRRYDEADQLAQIAVSQSKTKQSIDVEVRRRAQNMADMAASMHEEFQAAAAAEEKLKTTPDDAEANLLVGRFRCFRAEQWDVGLAFLAKAANPALAEAARLDLAAGDSAKARDSAASAWEKAAESAVGTERRECLERAYRTYELAINKGLKGVDRELARKRLDALRGLLPPLHPTISQTLADGATVEVHPGLLGRVLVGGRDTGVLVTYRPGQSLATATLKQIVTESRMKGVVQIELAGFMATTSRTTYARQFGGGKTMPQRLLIDSKVIATVDAQQAQKETTLDLPAQRHTLVWQLQGTDPTGAPSLELRDSNRISSVTTYYTKSMLENLRTSTLKKGETRKEYRLDGN
ncbi:MAG TPA: hypothetical protein PLV92_21380 [Pirellulaceae bacterium]|nr:hypothetical protein [Pirellulaceae bacterium]